MYNCVNQYKVVFLNCKYRRHHAVNENGGAEAVAPAEVLEVSSSITLACES